MWSAKEDTSDGVPSEIRAGARPLSRTVQAVPLPTGRNDPPVMRPPNEARLPITWKQVTWNAYQSSSWGVNLKLADPIGFSPSGPLLASKSKARLPDL